MATRLSITQGDTAILSLTVLDAAGGPLDLTDFEEIVFTIKRSIQDSDLAAVFQGSLTDGDIEIDPDDDDNHTALVTVPATATSAMRTGRLYFWDLELQASDNIFTPCDGTILPEGQVTRG